MRNLKRIYYLGDGVNWHLSSLQKVPFFIDFASQVVGLENKPRIDASFVRCRYLCVMSVARPAPIRSAAAEALKGCFEVEGSSINDVNKILK